VEEAFLGWEREMGEAWWWERKRRRRSVRKKEGWSFNSIGVVYNLTNTWRCII
jgi:hypothetical protein